MYRQLINFIPSTLFFLFLWIGHPSMIQAQQEMRGMWVDAFHPGYKSTAEIQDLVNRAAQGRFNAIYAEVLAYHDNNGGGHGAYWNSAIVPKATDINGNIDPLSELCAAAHAAGIEVHAWIVPYRSSFSWPPSGNNILAGHPEWVMVPQAAINSGPSTVGGVYVLDPGSPDVQEYLVDIVRELMNNYPIDGVNLDYIRYTQTDAGYPSSSSYSNSGLKRFQEITGYVGTPSPSESSWSDFRRRTITEFVRRCRAEVASAWNNPRQPLSLSADLIAFGNAPATFSGSSAYALFQDWQYWMEQGYLDAGIPMNYKREHCSTEASWYRNWVNASLGWRYNRHLYIGQGCYLNGFSQSVTQLSYGLGQGAQGALTFSYYSTRSQDTACNGSDIAVNDWGFYSYLGSNLFTFAANVPDMPWRDRFQAGEGTFWGQVTSAATGLPIDDATVQVGTQSAIQTDGNGYFVVTLIPSFPNGVVLPVTVTKAGFSTGFHPAAVVVAGESNRYDFQLNSTQYRLDMGTLFAGAQGSFRSLNATPQEEQYLLYSRFGPGSTFVPQLNVTLDLDRPELAAQATADPSGKAHWVLPIPSTANGLTVWMQVAEAGRVTNSLPVTIH